ncbi:MAG: UTP--glucose-1-phosphate uridylyltransferase [Clostridia bacterium]|nr:UTP--glucose-1-phosphate uridylyltransferase [Clostridia bacterium]
MEENAINILRKFNQGHIVDWMNRLHGEERNKLVEQVVNLNIEQVVDLYNNLSQTFEIGNKKIERISAIDVDKLSEKEFTSYKNKGIDIIKDKKYAVVTMAGGQGTRLGHTGPKGTFKVNVGGEEKYLFQIIVESLQKANEKYGVVIPWYLMTSEENNSQTLSFLEEHNYFGYPQEKVKLFKQGKVPLISTEGKLLIGEDKLIKEASDGNGSIYKSLKIDGILDDMRKNNIQWVFVGGVDNIVLEIVDPLLVGVTVSQNNKIASKSVIKTNPKERAGVFCKIDGKPGIIEYSELPEKMAEEVDEHGDLVFGDVNILSHLYNIEALEELADKVLPYHIAVKKSDYLDKEGNLITPEDKNVYKFESFIFDAFSNYSDISILRVKRANEFAPIKNREGNDSPETAVKLYNAKFGFVE